MIHPELYCHANSKVIEFWTYLWRQKSLESILHIYKKRLWKLKLFRINKKLETKNLWFIIESMSHPEKAKSSLYLGNYWLLSHAYQEKSCLKSRNKGKKLPLMYESSRKSYIIMLYRELSNWETWFWRQKRLDSKNNWFFFIFIGCLSHAEKGTSSEDVWVIQKNLHHHSMSKSIGFWGSIIKTKFD